MENQENRMTTFEGTLKRAKEGNALSQNLLALWLLKSDAISWLKEAATKGDLRGQLLLAEIYATDERCNNKDEALYWFCQLSQHESLRNPELIGYAF